jgi:hypothetical protein
MKMLTLSLILFALPLISHARGYGNHSFWQQVEEQRCRQRDLIDNGFVSGQLTQREMNHLRGEQRHADQQVRHYKQLGYLSYAYQRELMNYLDHISDRISHLKHNGEHIDLHRRSHDNNPFARNNHRYDRNNYNSTLEINHGPVGFYYRF